MFFVFFGGGYFLATFAFFSLLPSMFYWNIYIFFLSESQFMSVVKIRQRSLPEAHVKKKNKFDVFKFYLNVRFWAWKKNPN